MRKPKLEYYGLSEEDLEEYEKQKEEYYIVERMESNKCDSYNTRLKIVVAILTIIYGIVASIISVNNEEDAGVTATVVFFIIPVVFCFGCYVCRAYKEDESIDWGMFLGSVMFLIIAMGIAMYHLFERVPKIDRYKYIDKKLESSINQYNSDTREYEQYIEKCKRDFWNSLSGLQFEKEVAALYRNHGYNAIVTSATGDGGVDIILIKDGERIAVQCKHHAKAIGPHDIRALQGVVASSNYTRGIFVSLNGYTTSAREEAKMSRVKVSLLDLNDILEMAKDDDMIIGGESDPLPPKPLPPKPLPPKPQPPKPNVEINNLYDNLSDESLNLLIGKKIKHKIDEFGVGQIVKIEKRANNHKYIYIYFPNMAEEKMFPFPDAFATKIIEPVDFKVVKKN